MRLPRPVHEGRPVDPARRHRRHQASVRAGVLAAALALLPAIGCSTADSTDDTSDPGAPIPAPMTDLIRPVPESVPLIDARVASVDTDLDPPFVLLTVGSDDKVEKGFHFFV